MSHSLAGLGAGFPTLALIAALAASSIGVALLAARSLALPIRQAMDALAPLVAAGSDKPQSRSEIARFHATIGEVVAAAMCRQQTGTEQRELDKAERAARRAKLSNM